MDQESPKRHRESLSDQPLQAVAAPKPNSPLKVLFVASEVSPYAKTGGLADVLGSLPRALANRGHECAVVAPLYRCARQAGAPLEPTPHAFEIPIASRKWRGRLWRGCLPHSNVPVYLVEQREYFNREDPARGHGLYQYRLPNGQMKDYPDNCQRFIFLCRAALAALPLLDFWPDVIHCNDWQTGLIPAYLREDKVYAERREYSAIRTLFAIHNVAYQGIFWHWDMVLTGLDWGLFNWRQLEFFGHLNLLKAGIVFADAISTVSPRYAQEIQTDEYGYHLEGVLRHHRNKLVGIVNGVDYTEWNPATDPHLPVPYNIETVAAGKAACKAALQRDVRLPERADVPLLGMISRLVHQKGVDLLQAVAEELLSEDLQLVVLGTGDAVYQRMLQKLAAEHPKKVSAAFEFSESRAHRIEAGADVFLMPSRYEPSGLNQLYSLKYGTIPIVRDTGGLHDTVTDCTSETLADGTASGFKFEEYSPEAFLAAIRRALQMYRRHPDRWQQLIRTGMSQDWSWGRSAAAYEEVYRRLQSAQKGK